MCMCVCMCVCVCVCVCVWARATAHNLLPAGVKKNTDNFLSPALLTSYSQVCKTNDKYQRKNHAPFVSLWLIFWPRNILSEF